MLNPMETHFSARASHGDGHGRDGALRLRCQPHATEIRANFSAVRSISLLHQATAVARAKSFEAIDSMSSAGEGNHEDAADRGCQSSREDGVVWQRGVREIGGRGSTELLQLRRSRGRGGICWPRAQE